MYERDQCACVYVCVRERKGGRGGVGEREHGQIWRPWGGVRYEAYEALGISLRDERFRPGNAIENVFTKMFPKIPLVSL